MNEIRCVVTGHDERGNSVVRSDEIIPATEPSVLPGYKFFQLWGSDTAPEFPDEGTRPAFPTFMPAEGGLRFAVFTVPPAGERTAQEARLSPHELASAVDRDLPGFMTYHEPNGTGFHKTPTIDFEVVLEGRVVLELDDGTRVDLGPGDAVVQNGTRHRWLNVSDGPATVAVILHGVRHSDIT
ncbi:MAG TPA: cupin domain-containing protein [Jatrophihabitantaceae bacterium]|jgi:hypothetical protein|nr:cupin domain-containing protein [Jatrophihabitantaceae bacterium]